MRSASSVFVGVVVAAVIASASGCRALGGRVECADDDDCAGFGRCGALGVCEDGGPTRGEGEGEEGEGEEGEGEPGEGEGEGAEGEGEGEEGEGEGNPLLAVVVAAVDDVTAPVSCAGRSTLVDVLLTNPTDAAIAVDFVEPTGVARVGPAGPVSLAAGGTRTVSFSVNVGVLVGDRPVVLTLQAPGFDDDDLVFRVQLVATGTSNAVDVPPLVNDVLLVLENAGSMGDNIPVLADEILEPGGFVADVFAIGGDVRLAVITADDPPQAEHGRGTACPATGQVVHTTAQSATCAGNAVWDGTFGSGTETPIAGAVAWFSEPRYTADNGAMLRADGRFHIISIGDSPDASGLANSDVVDDFAALTPGRTRQTIFSAFHVVTPGNKSCPGTGQDPPLTNLITATDGERGDICVSASRDAFYGGLLDRIAVPVDALDVTGLGAGGVVVACLEVDGDCLVVPDAVVRDAAGIHPVDGRLADARVRVMTSETCNLP